MSKRLPDAWQYENIWLCIQGNYFLQIIVLFSQNATLIWHDFSRLYYNIWQYTFNFASCMRYHIFLHCHCVSLTFGYLRLTSNASLLYILMVIFYSAFLCYSIIKYCAVFTLLHALATWNDLLSTFLNGFFFLIYLLLYFSFQFWILCTVLSGA